MNSYFLGIKPPTQAGERSGHSELDPLIAALQKKNMHLLEEIKEMDYILRKHETQEAAEHPQNSLINMQGELRNLKQRIRMYQS